MLNILSGLIPDIVSKGIEIFDKKFQTDAEKEQAVRAFEIESQERLQSAWNEEQKQLTERHKNDMHSDSWLSKNIRPLVLLYLLGLLTLAFFSNVPEATMELLSNLLMTAFVFYFGSRTVEKMGKMVMHSKKGK